MIWLPVVGNYADIDVYASIIAYADLLNQRGKPAQTYIPTAPNYSVPATLHIPEAENTHFALQPTDQAIILDISIPEEISKFVPDNQILEIIDHHPGYEEYWHRRIGDKAIIEKIGAVATSVFEWWGECWDYGKMSPEIAKLLLAAILDNTLNFNASITTERDHQAAQKLAAIIDTTVENFATWYFTEVSKTVVSNLQNSLLQDCKTATLPTNQSTFAFCQLTLWNTKNILKQADKVSQIMSNKGSSWLVNVLCISERKNYILTSSEQLSEYFTQLLDLKQQDPWLISNQLYLRKEILGKMLE